MSKIDARYLNQMLTDAQQESTPVAVGMLIEVVFALIQVIERMQKDAKS